MGTIQFPGGPAIPLPGILAPDPGPGGLALALTYNLLGPPSLVAGDLLVFEQGSPTVVSDILRFNPAGTGNPNYPASVVVYSLAGGGDLADTGLPTARYTNLFSITELNGAVSYTPNAGQPGFVAGFEVTYNFVSDAPTNPVPAPAGLLLGLTGLPIFGLVARLRRRTAVQAA